MSFPRYPSYKDSGVEWLGEVPGHWAVKRLKRNVRLLTDKTERRDHPVALENIEGWTGRFIPTETEFQGEGIAFEPGDILFGKLRPYLAKAYRAEFSGEAVGDFHVMRPVTGIDSRFAQYQILNREFIAIVDGSTFGSKMPRASWEFVGDMQVTTPPLPEQIQIAAFLDRETAKIDALVAEQRRLMELLREKRQAVISHAVTKGLNPNAPMKPSGIEWLGDVPAHWSATPLKHLCELLKDGTHLPPTRVDEGIPLLSVRNLVDDAFVLRDDDSMISEESYQELCRAFVPKPNDVLLAIVGATLGKSALVADNMGRFHIQRSVAIFRTRANELCADFLHLVFQSNSFQSLLWKQVGYSAQPGIYLGTLQNIRVPTPPIDEQHQLVSLIRPAIATLANLQAEAQRAIDLLQERRTALISASVTGQIDVRHLSGEIAD
jgi:type I restriction enzyme, S subunit